MTLRFSPRRITPRLASWLAVICAAMVMLTSSSLRLAAQGGQLVDLELILAVDTASRVSSREFDLQMQGLASAFLHPSVQAAIEAAGDLGVGVSMVQWSDNRKQTLAIPWQVLRDAPSAEAFSAEISRTPRFLVGGGTALGGALDFSMRQFDGNGLEGRRKVIDISGDGRTNQGAHPSRFRDQAVALGITINGLAILNEDVYVDRYYRYNVIGGTGAFVMTAQDYEDFSVAILEKLIKEIAGAPVAGLPAPRSNPEPPHLAAASALQLAP